MKSERGESLVEVVVTVAIVALACAAVLSGTLVATHRFGPTLEQSALQAAVHREMRVAVDVLKYQGNILVPTTVATSIPVPGASPLAAHVSLSTSRLSSGATTIGIAASLDSNTDTVTLSTTVAPPVPLPSSTVLVSGSAPQ